MIGKSATLRQALAAGHRRLLALPFAVAAATTAAALLLALFVDREEHRYRQQQERAEVGVELSAIHARLEKALVEPLAATHAMVAEVVAHGGITAPEFDAAARVLLAGHRDARSFSLARGTVISLVYPAARSAVVGIDYRDVPREWPEVEQAIRLRRPVLAGPVPLLLGGQGLIGREPIFLPDPAGGPDRFFGLASVVIDLAGVLDDSGLARPNPPITVALRERDGQGAAGGMIAGDAAVFSQAPVEMNVELPTGTWQAAAVPRAGWDRGDADLRRIRVLEILFVLVAAAASLVAARLSVLRGLADHTLRKSRANLAEAQRIAHLGSWVLDVDRNELTWSDEMYRIFGIPPAEFAGNRETFLGALHPDDRQAVDRQYHASVAGLAEYDIKYRFIRRSDGDVRWGHTRAVHERDSRGRVVRSVGTVEDITEWRAVERALMESEARHRKAREEAEAANLAKSRLLAAASHDLGQPLFAAKLQYELFACGGGPESLEKLGMYLETLSDMLAETIEHCRAEVQAPSAALVDVDLGAAIGRVAGMYAAAAAAKGIRLRVMPTSLSARSDPSLLNHILLNLVSNAVRYTDRGGVVIGCRRRKDAVRVEVWDSGRGIPTESIKDIFEEFRQVAATGEGTGLGLAIVRQAARRLGHGIDVRSRLGRGSVFAVTIAAAGPPNC